MRSAAGGFGARRLLLPTCGAIFGRVTNRYENRTHTLRSATPLPHQTKPIAGFRPIPSELGEPAAGRDRRRVPSQPLGRHPGGWGRGINPKINYGFRRKKGLGACQSQPEATIAKCVHCEDSRSLRYDQAAGGWVCFQGCGTQPQSEPGLKRGRTKKLQWKRSPLFEPVALVDGVRRKLHHTELREAYRLWAQHKDIREGRMK